MQLREYEGMVRRNADADPSHVEALLRLVGRRPDADLVFADAGRRAARRAVSGLSGVTRLAARIVPRARSEERRVGKECRSRASRCQLSKKDDMMYGVMLLWLS